MLKSVSIASLLAIGLAASPSLQAQTGHVAPGGTLAIVVAANVTKLFKEQNIDVTYIGSGPVRRGEKFDVTGGAVKLSNGAGSATSLGAMTFTEGSNTVALNQFDLLATAHNAYITANVVVNGKDEGRFPVFELAANLYMPPICYGPYSSGPVRFIINPDFQSEFADYIPISGLDPNSSLGVFSLDVTIEKKKN